MRYALAEMSAQKDKLAVTFAFAVSKFLYRNLYQGEGRRSAQCTASPVFLGGRCGRLGATGQTLKHINESVGCAASCFAKATQDELLHTYFLLFNFTGLICVQRSCFAKATQDVGCKLLAENQGHREI